MVNRRVWWGDSEWTGDMNQEADVSKWTVCDAQRRPGCILVLIVGSVLSSLYCITLRWVVLHCIVSGFVQEWRRMYWQYCEERCVRIGVCTGRSMPHGLSGSEDVVGDSKTEQSCGCKSRNNKPLLTGWSTWSLEAVGVRGGGRWLLNCLFSSARYGHFH